MKNERAAIVALSFGIGFITAFIAYGLNDSQAPIPSNEVPDVGEQSAIRTTLTPERNLAAVAGAYAAVEESGLYFVDAGTKTLVNPSYKTAPHIAQAHDMIHQARISPDQQYLFYCAELPTTPAQCEPHIFSKEAFTIYPVQRSGGTIQIPTDELQVSWTSDNRLVLNGQVSAPGANPWQVE